VLSRVPERRLGEKADVPFARIEARILEIVPKRAVGSDEHIAKMRIAEDRRGAPATTRTTASSRPVRDVHPLLAGIIQQPLAQVFPDRSGSGAGSRPPSESRRCGRSGGTRLAALDVGQRLPPDRGAGSAIGGGVVQEGLPILARQVVAVTRRSRRRHVSADGTRSGQLLHLLRGWYAPACGSIGHGAQNLTRTKESSPRKPESRKNDPAEGVAGVGTKVRHSS
jgi:hypothetical protein